MSPAKSQQGIRIYHDTHAIFLDTFLSTCIVFLGSKLLSRTGNQIHVADKYSIKDPRPVLEIMADPSE